MITVDSGALGAFAVVVLGAAVFRTDMQIRDERINVKNLPATHHASIRASNILVIKTPVADRNNSLPRAVLVCASPEMDDIHTSMAFKAGHTVMILDVLPFIFFCLSSIAGHFFSKVVCNHTDNQWIP